MPRRRLQVKVSYAPTGTRGTGPGYPDGVSQDRADRLDDSSHLQFCRLLLPLTKGCMIRKTLQDIFFESREFAGNVMLQIFYSLKNLDIPGSPL